MEMTRLTIHSTHNESYLRCVSGASEVGVDLFRFCLIQRHEPVQDVVACGGIIGTTLGSVSSRTFRMQERGAYHHNLGSNSAWG